jgi:phosphate transport system substrate-binding protein
MRLVAGLVSVGRAPPPPLNGGQIMRSKLIAALALSVIGVSSAYAAGKQDAVIVKGSDTMVTLSAHWAESFMAANPGKSIAVTGGGSGVGISALLGGTCDIANASRDVTPAEKQKGLDAGVVPVETNVALDGIAIVVNPVNPLTEATIEQLRRIYTGEVTNWKDVGGPEGKIIVLSRETSSGTYVFFQEHVLQKRDYATSVRLMPATSAIIESVASDKTAIGYVGLGYAEKPKTASRF